MSTLLSCTIDAPAAYLRLDSPHNRNALSSSLMAQLTTNIHHMSTESSVRAIVLDHSGNTFCSGLDLTELTHDASRQDGPQGIYEKTCALVDLLRTILTCPLPVIALINGHVRAGGMGLIGACDLVLAGPQATFGFTEARIGVSPAVISLTVLAKITPQAGSYYYLTAQQFGPQQAQQIGLITEYCENPRQHVQQYLHAIALGSPQGIAESKALLTAPILARFDCEASRLAQRSAQLFHSPQAQEGIRAFRHKRSPWWVTTDEQYHS